MGIFLSNIQVHVGAENRLEAVRADIANHLRNWVLRNPYRLVEKNEPVDREIIVGPVGSEPWITIWDEETENGDLEHIDAITKSLSRATQRDSVGLLLYQDEALALRLWRKGRLIDTYNSDPELFEGRVLSHRERNRMSGKAEQWAPLLEGASPEDLRSIWSTDFVFAHDAIRHMAPLFRWKLDMVLRGRNELTPKVLKKSIVLQFRRAGRFARKASVYSIGPTPPLSSEETSARRPLKYWSSEGAAEALRAMETPSTLFSIASLGADRPTCLEHARPLFREWHRFLMNHSEAVPYEIVVGTQKKGTLALQSLPAHSLETPEWSLLWDRVRDGASLCASLRPRLPQPRAERLGVPERQESSPRQSGTRLRSVSRGSGFAIRTATDQRLALHVSFWLDLQDAHADRHAQASSLLERLIDRLMSTSEGLQAVLASWDYAPTYAMDVLPYETACGIGGHCTMSVVWCQRFLRAVGDIKWLGPELVRRLGSPTELESVAETSPLRDGGLKVRRRPGTTLDVLERALEGLLPNREDWQHSMDELHRMRGSR